MEIIDARTPFWVFISEHADKLYQDTLFDSDRLDRQKLNSDHGRFQ